MRCTSCSNNDNVAALRIRVLRVDLFVKFLNEGEHKRFLLGRSVLSSFCRYQLGMGLYCYRLTYSLRRFYRSVHPGFPDRATPQRDSFYPAFDAPFGQKIQLNRVFQSPEYARKPLTYPSAHHDTTHHVINGATDNQGIGVIAGNDFHQTPRTLIK